MQNTATHSTGSHNWASNTAQPNLPNMYASHQRNTSNPRAYAADAGVTGEARRDDSNLYTGQEGYGSYQQNYMGGVGGYPYAGNVGLSGYATTGASGSRRTSGTTAAKAATPPSTNPSSAANQSPSSRYFAGQPSSATDSSHLASSSPYQAASAPAHQTTHHQSQLGGQPQTAHPYGGGYQDYYGSHQYPNQWQHYQNQGFQQPTPTTSRPAQGGASATTPTMTQSSTMGETAHPQRTPTSATYEYPQYGWQHDNNTSRNSSSQWQQPHRSSGGNGQVNQHAMAQQQWQYAQQMPQSIPPHQMQQGHMAPGQYPWQQPPQWNQGFYPPPTHQAQGVAPQAATAASAVPAAATSSPTTGKKGKKDKKDKSGDAEQVLGKRPAESATEDESEDKKEGSKKKKSHKKEEEKPVPKPPAKSHLHPPRQAQSAWQLFFNDELNKAKAAATTGHSPGGTPQHAKLNVAQIAKDAGASYAQLDDAQKAYYAQKVQESKEQYAKDLAAWQATLTPEDIRVENAFRAQQRKEGKSRKGNLKDPNAPKKPLSAYFLFLKGIREDDALRARVWADETETTKQSVLAAERWRSLTDDEKKPFLQQAEKDKQDYEAARKIYEDDAAARARGEDVPDRPIHPQSTSSPPHLDLKSLRDDPKKEIKSDDIVTDRHGAPTLAGFHNDSEEDLKAESDAHPFEDSMELDEFHGFRDPLEGMDLTGLGGMGDSGQEHQQWDELQHFMDNVPEADAQPDVTTTKIEEIPEPAAPAVIDQVMSTEEVSVAPALEEAVAETAEIPASAETAIEHPSEVAAEVALQAEGESVVPPVATEAFEAYESVPVEPEVSADASGVPTEEVNELPPADLPPVVDEVPTSTIDQVEAVEASTEEAAAEASTEEAEDVFEAAALGGDAVPEAFDEVPSGSTEDAPTELDGVAPNGDVASDLAPAVDGI